MVKRVLLVFLFVLAAFTPARRADAATRIVLLENEKFSIWRLTFAAGEKQANIHPPPGKGQIVTLVTPGDVEINFEENGQKRVDKGRMEPGKTWWLSPTTLHQFANTGSAPYDVIVVTFLQ